METLRMSEAKAKSGAFKKGWYLREEWCAGCDGLSAGAWRFAYTFGEVNKEPCLVNNSRFIMKRFDEMPDNGVFI
jgi:hypothetical protein